MKFADFVSRDAIRADLTADDKEGVIREMVQALLDSGRINGEELDSIVKAILKREELGSTGIGRGVGALAILDDLNPRIEPAGAEDEQPGSPQVEPLGIGYNHRPCCFVFGHRCQPFPLDKPQ